jgi:hypothetical protein
MPTVRQEINLVNKVLGSSFSYPAIASLNTYDYYGNNTYYFEINGYIPSGTGVATASLIGNLVSTGPGSLPSLNTTYTASVVNIANTGYPSLIRQQFTPLTGTTNFNLKVFVPSTAALSINLARIVVINDNQAASNNNWDQNNPVSSIVIPYNTQPFYTQSNSTKTLNGLVIGGFDQNDDLLYVSNQTANTASVVQIRKDFGGNIIPYLYTPAGSWISAISVDNYHIAAFDNSFTPPNTITIDPYAMVQGKTVVTTSGQASASCAIGDSWYYYVGFQTNPGLIVAYGKDGPFATIVPVTRSFTFSTGRYGVLSISQDSNYIYAGITTSVGGAVVILSKSNFTTNTVFTFSNGLGYYPYGIANDSNYIYATIGSTFSGTSSIIRINKSDFVTATSISLPYLGRAYNLTIDDNYLYCVVQGSTSIGYVSRISTSNFSSINTIYLGITGSSISGITNRIYGALVDDLNFYTTNGVDTVIKISKVTPVNIGSLSSNIEIGSDQTFTASATASLTYPKYFQFNNQYWNSDPYYYVETTAGLTGPALATASIALQVDSNIPFTGFTALGSTSVSGGGYITNFYGAGTYEFGPSLTGSVVTTTITRSAATASLITLGPYGTKFSYPPLTPNRNYRMAYTVTSVTASGSTLSVYNAKLRIKLEPGKIGFGTTPFTYSLGSGQNNISYTLHDSNYIYNAHLTSPAIITRINRNDFVTGNASLTFSTGQNNATSLAQDDSYLYVGLGTSPGVLIRVNKSDFATYTSITFSTGRNNINDLTYDGYNIFAGWGVSNGGIVKVNTSAGTFSQNSVIGALTFSSYVNTLTQDQCWVFAGLYGSTTQIASIYKGASGSPTSSSDFINNASVVISTQSLAAGQSYITSLIQDNVYLYASLNTSPGIVVRNRKTTYLSGPPVLDSVTFSTGQNYPFQLTQDQNFVYAGLSTSPGAVLRMSKANWGTYSIISVSFSAAQNGAVQGLDADNTYIYAGLNTSPGQIVRLNKYTGRITNLESQYLLSNTLVPSGIGTAGYPTNWNLSEWAGLSPSYVFVADGSTASTSVIGLITVTTSAGATSVSGSTVSFVRGIGETFSGNLLLPPGSTYSYIFDSRALINNNDIFATKIIARVAPGKRRSSGRGYFNGM